MKVRAIGCHGGVAPDYQTSCYQIDDRFLIDCGSASSGLTPEEQMQLTDIFITHPHLDHVKDICFIIENTFSPDRQPMILRSTPEILEDVHRHLLNDVIWPDFSKIGVGPNRDRFLLQFAPITEGEAAVENIRIRPFPVNHPGHAVGYILDSGDQQLIFSGDSGPCREIWEAANACPNLKGIFTEITFPSHLDWLAKAAGHFTLKQLKEDILTLKKNNVPVYISHFKPLYLEQLLDEFKQNAPDHFHLLHENDIIIFS